MQGPTHDKAGGSTLPEWAESLIGALEAQQALVDELTPLAERQGALIREGRSDALLDLLAQRQQIIDRFMTESEGLSSRLGDAAGRLDTLAEEPRRRIRTLIARIDEQLAHVLSVDERDHQSLKEARDGARQQLASIDVGRSARSAYLKSAGASRFADHRG